VARQRLLVLALAVALAVGPVACGWSGPRGTPEGPPASSAAARTTGPPLVDTNATVIRVIDGDTIDVSVGHRRERVRFIGVNTPETKDPDKPVQCYGPEASHLTARLLPVGSRVRLERDVEARDDYGRLLAYVYRGTDGLFVNLDLAREGAAVALSIRPNTTHAAVIAAAIDEARAAGRGLWSACR
jgi:micrococcal nuclease